MLIFTALIQNIALLCTLIEELLFITVTFLHIFLKEERKKPEKKEKRKPYIRRCRKVSRFLDIYFMPLEIIKR